MNEGHRATDSNMPKSCACLDQKPSPNVTLVKEKDMDTRTCGRLTGSHVDFIGNMELERNCQHAQRRITQKESHIISS